MSYVRTLTIYLLLVYFVAAVIHGRHYEINMFENFHQVVKRVNPKANTILRKLLFHEENY